MDRLACDRMYAAVLETGSFAAAARQIGTSSGQASKLVAALENRLGVRLLNRTTRALAPTELGQAYFEQIRAILTDLDALDESLVDAGGPPRGRLRLSVPLNFGAVELSQSLNRFAARNPGIALDVSFTDRKVNLVEEGYDAAIRIGTPEDSGLIARRLRETRSIAVAAPAYLARAGTPAVPADLAGHDCILDSVRQPPRLWRFRDGTVQVDGRLQFSNASACADAAEQGLGIAYVPDFAARAGLEAGRLVQILSGHETPPFAIHALYPAGRHLARKVRVLVDFLAKDLATPQ